MRTSYLYGCMFQSFRIMILEKLRQEIPEESLWFPSAKGKKQRTSQNSALALAWNLSPILAAPPLSSKNKPFFCDFLAHLFNVPESEQAVPWLKQTC